MFTKFIDDNGNTWLTCEYLTSGNYVGSLMGKSNMQTLMDSEYGVKFFNNVSGRCFGISGNRYRIYTDMIFSENADISPDYDNTQILIISEAFSTDSVYIRECKETEDLIASLANYPVLDDEQYEKTCYDARVDACEDVLDSLKRKLMSEYDNWYDWYSLTPCKKLGNAYPCDIFYEKALDDIVLAEELSGAEWVYEYDTAWIDPDKIYEEWKNLFFADIREAMSSK